MAQDPTRSHRYHAYADVLSGSLQLPVNQLIPPQASASLPEEGGYLGQQACDYRLESVMSFSSAYTQVAGNHDVKPGHGWATLSTSVVEGLNVLDVVTADRVVAQVSTEHPLAGYVPTVTFLGTRFDNLRIAGHPVHLDLDAHFLGAAPQDDTAYTRDPVFRQRVATQYENLGKQEDLPEEVRERYNQLPSSSDAEESIECSLIQRAEGSWPGRGFGHVIDVPNFGRIYLATVRVEHSDWKPETATPRKTQISLSMLDLRMGCIAAGQAQIAKSVVNGSGQP